MKSCQVAIGACDKTEVGEERTFAMNPQERAHRYPFLKPVALSEPRGSPFEMFSPGNVVIRRGIRGREPTSNVYLKLVP